MRWYTLLGSLCCLQLAGPAQARDSAAPKAVPPTRPEMKKSLEDLKVRVARLPLPAMTDEELAKAGGRVANNGRMRALYLPADLRGEFSRGGDRGAESGMTLDRNFKTMFFWIVSRGNNCHYCLGHQENKLLAGGIKEDAIAALDGDWSEFTPAERAAFAMTLKLTHEPHKVGEADVAALRKHYKDPQIVEILLTVAGNNATNRWTDSLGIPTEKARVYLTDTPEKYRSARSRVAPMCDGKPGHPPERPALESRAEVEKRLEVARKRTPWLPLGPEEAARKTLTTGLPEGPVPQWVLLLANFPSSGLSRAKGVLALEDKGKLDRKLCAKVWWVAARHDRAWYALGRARLRLLAQGLTDDDVFALDAPDAGATAGEKAALAFTRKLTVTPALISDDDIAGLRKHYKDQEVAELVHRVTQAAFLNRVTEPAGLRLETK